MVVLGRVPHIFVFLLSMLFTCHTATDTNSHELDGSTRISSWLASHRSQVHTPGIKTRIQKYKPQTLIQNVYINVNTLLGRITHALLSWHFWGLHDFPGWNPIWWDMVVIFLQGFLDGRKKLNPFASDILDALSKACWLDLFCDPGFVSVGRSHSSRCESKCLNPLNKNWGWIPSTYWKPYLSGDIPMYSLEAQLPTTSRINAISSSRHGWRVPGLDR